MLIMYDDFIKNDYFFNDQVTIFPKRRLNIIHTEYIS